MRCCHALSLSSILLVAPLAIAQQPGRSTAPEYPGISRVLAGVREHSPDTIAALGVIAEDPSLLRTLLESARGEPRRPADSQPPARSFTTEALNPDWQRAIERLSRTPEVLLLAAAAPQALRTLHEAFEISADGTLARIDELRTNYRNARRQAARAWQAMLQDDPVALREYEELLAAFCRDLERNGSSVPSVVVLKRDYFYACPPDATLLAFAEAQRLPRTLGVVLDHWSDQYGPQVIDDRVLSGLQYEAAVPADGRFLVDAAPAERAAMWRPLDAGEDLAERLMPAALQPPQDRAPAAQVAVALAEQARLWLFASVEPQPVVAGAERIPASGAVERGAEYAGIHAALGTGGFGVYDYGRSGACGPGGCGTGYYGGSLYYSPFYDRWFPIVPYGYPGVVAYSAGTPYIHYGTGHSRYTSRYGRHLHDGNRGFRHRRPRLMIRYPRTLNDYRRRSGGSSGLGAIRSAGPSRVLRGPSVGRGARPHSRAGSMRSGHRLHGAPKRRP